MKRPVILILALSVILGGAPVAFGQGAKAATTAAPVAKASYTVSAVKQQVVQKSAQTITAAQLKDYLSFVASDEMEGRATPSRGLYTTA